MKSEYYDITDGCGFPGSKQAHFLTTPNSLTTIYNKDSFRDFNAAMLHLVGGVYLPLLD